MAQWEIRRLFQLIRHEVFTVSPFLGSFLAPKCVPLGYCDEFNNRDEHCPIRPHKDNVLGHGPRSAMPHARRAGTCRSLGRRERPSARAEPGDEARPVAHVQGRGPEPAVRHTPPSASRTETVAMTRDEERLARSREEPIVGGLPDVPGIVAAMRLTPGLGTHLRGLADELLVNDFPGTTLTRADREMLATAVSAANDCFFCMDSHGAHAGALLERTGATDLLPLIDTLKSGSSEGFGDKMRALLHIARTVRGEARDLTAADVSAALAAGATDADVQLAVLIAAAFSMYNRMVDGLRARTAPSPEAYRRRAAEIAVRGYS